MLEKLGFKHQVVLAPKGKAGTEIEPFKWLNVVLGNLKTALSGTHYAFKFAKYAQRYLADVQYRFNRRFDLATYIAKIANNTANVFTAYSFLPGTRSVEVVQLTAGLGHSVILNQPLLLLLRAFPYV